MVAIITTSTTQQLKRIKMKATATRIGKSKKECIIVDGKVFIKSCVIGKWTHLVEAYSENHSTIETKHRDINSAKISMKSQVNSHSAYRKSQGVNTSINFKIIEVARQ